MITANRYHDISCGHRVAGHESKCAMLHGHNYRIHFTCAGELDEIGRVLDFSVIKSKLCMWVEENWDHRFLAWQSDPFIAALSDMLPPGKTRDLFDESIVWVSFNPTAENMADYLLYMVGPHQLRGSGVKLIKVVIEETRKCSATSQL